MKDIGFGTLDHRTVITVLFTLVLMQLLFGLQIPVDMKNIVQLFIDLVVLTGYIYLARTIYRLPVAILISSMIGIGALSEIFEGRKEAQNNPKIDSNSGVVNKHKTFSSWLLFLVFAPIAFLVILLIQTFTFGELVADREIQKTMPKKLFYFYHDHFKLLNAIFGILDRTGVVFIAVIATIPNFSNYVKVIGIGGVVAMIVLYVLRGDFTALMKDITEKKEIN
jgi:hypothetical protein